MWATSAMMRRVLVLAVLASSAAAFHAPAAGFLRQRLRTAASPRLRQVRDCDAISAAVPQGCCSDRRVPWRLQAPVSPVRLAAAGGDDPEVVFDANAGWQADHNKAAAAMASGGHQQLKIKYGSLSLWWQVFARAALPFSASWRVPEGE